MPSRKVVLKLPARPAAQRRKAVSDDESSENETERSSEIEQSLSDSDEDNGRADDDEDEEDEVDADDVDEEEETIEEVAEENPSDLIDDEDSLGEEEESGWYDRDQVTARRRNRDLADPFDRAAALDALERPNARKKKVLSVEEQRIKRAELARRRKNLSERRLEEEKQDTVDKLLKRRAAKTRKNGERDAESLQRVLPIHPAIMSWRSGANGFSLSMTAERGAL